ncbi:hypothetical protein Vadar_016943 [Vaccinium darrowii]|uniref:Uncharacterized protein n=1 Tax=Vaccinium darrowii TaxID=229202 RepID=A0ACB7Z450_9ERIC|nr:hypothetical protein Vadar_016943 [Vaccinium darrowii]
MSKQVCPMKDVTIERKRYTIEAMVVEKSMPQTTSKIAKPYQRIVLQDAEGTIFAEDIAILSNTLKMFQTYSISNATVDTLDVQHRFVDHCFQLKISARTPIQAKLVDGLTSRTLKFDFTPIADIRAIEDVDTKIDMLFAILEVGPKKPAGNSMVVDLHIIDQGYLVCPFIYPLIVSYANFSNVIVSNRVKFEVEIKDPTGQISAAMFAEEAEEFYKITSA